MLCWLLRLKGTPLCLTNESVDAGYFCVQMPMYFSLVSVLRAWKQYRDLLLSLSVIVWKKISKGFGYMLMIHLLCFFHSPSPTVAYENKEMSVKHIFLVQTHTQRRAKKNLRIHIKKVESLKHVKGKGKQDAGRLRIIFSCLFSLLVISRESFPKGEKKSCLEVFFSGFEFSWIFVVAALLSISWQYFIVQGSSKKFVHAYEKS